jgi:hypothetical protein
MTMGDRFAMHSYPAAMSALPQPFMVPTRWHPLRVTAAILTFVALVLVVVSTFLPLYEGEMSFGSPDSGIPSETLKVTFTPWSAEYSQTELAGGPGDVPQLGYPLVFAAVALACAAAACWYAATPAASRTAGRAAGVLTSITGAFLIGTVWTTALLVTNGVDSFLLLDSLGDGIETDASYLAGYWLLLAATLIGFAAAVLSMLPTRQPVWQPPAPVNPYVPTPSYGLAIPAEPVVHTLPPEPVKGMQPVVHALPPEPVEGMPPSGQPLSVDPLTGQPLSPGRPPGGVPGLDPVLGQPPAHGPVSAQPDPLTNGAGPYAVPFTTEPVLPANGTAPEPQSAEPPPIVLPDAPPPEPPPGPAIPASEDPLAEPPKN